MSQLSPLDAMFLLLERRHAPFHVGALSLFRPPADAPRDFGAQLVARLNRASAAEAPFDQRLASRRGLGRWEPDPDFALDQHFIHLTLPGSGRLAELPAVVSRIHGALLDREAPLWRIYLIDGLEDGRIAMYSKIHHAVVDGVAGIRLMLKSMSADAGASTQMPPPWQLPALRRPPDPEPVSLVARVNTALCLAARALSAIPVVVDQLKLTFDDYRARHPPAITSFQAQRCRFNRPISGSRHFAVRSYSAARIKAVADRLGGTSNDVVLALCSAALRRYLIDHEDLPDAPLIAAVPVSTRRDDSDAGNEIAGALIDLATDRSDPVARFQAIKECMDYNKRRIRQMTPAQLLAYSAVLLAPGLLTMLPGARRTIANVVISHVPGPRQPMYWQGCLLEGIYPASLLLNGFALNITLISRHDSVDFGLLACRRTVPDLERLLDHLQDALAELESASASDVVAAPPALPVPRPSRSARRTLSSVAVASPRTGPRTSARLGGRLPRYAQEL